MTISARKNRWRRLVKLFRADQLRDKGMFTSTRQAEVLNPAVVDTQHSMDSAFYGMSQTTGQPWFHSIHDLYAKDEVQGSNVVVLGGYNMGKSSLIKTVYGTRAIASGARVCVFDRKRQKGDHHHGGEYERMMDVCGDDATQITFDRRPGVGTIVNLLDPAILQKGDDETMVGQDELLVLVAEAATGRKLLDDEDAAPAFALRQAHKAALAHAKAHNRVPVLRDVIDALYSPTDDSLPGPRDSAGDSLLASSGIVTIETLTRWGLPVATSLEKFVDGELSGLIDGPTSAGIDVAKKLIVFDTSSLEEGSAALGLMMVIAMAFINARWSVIPGAKYLVVEEAYNVDALEGLPEKFRALAKRGRGSGIVIVSVFHRLSDLPAGSPMWALIKESDVVHILRQSNAEDVELAMKFFDLPGEAAAAALRTMRQGEHLLRIKNRPPHRVLHQRSSTEVWMTNTDAGMTSGSEPAPLAAS